MAAVEFEDMVPLMNVERSGRRDVRHGAETHQQRMELR
jgi:hypothetical protein